MHFAERVGGVVLLVMDIFLITLILFVGLHDTWRSQRWIMANGHELSWALGLMKIKAVAICTTEAYESFHAACMSILKNTSTFVANVAWMLCNIPRAGLPIEPPELVPHFEHLYAPSCTQMQLVAHSLWVVLGLVVGAAGVGLAAFCLLALRLHYGLRPRFGKLYISGLVLRCIQVILLATALLYFGVTIPRPLLEIFNSHVPGPDQVIFHHAPIGGGGGVEVGFVFMCIFLVLSVLETTAYAVWTPGGNPLTPGKQERRDAARMAEKSSFWSYMPHPEGAIAPNLDGAPQTAAPGLAGYYHESAPLINRGMYTVTTIQTTEETDSPVPLSRSVLDYI